MSDPLRPNNVLLGTGRHSIGSTMCRCSMCHCLRAVKLTLDFPTTFTALKQCFVPDCAVPHRWTVRHCLKAASQPAPSFTQAAAFKQWHGLVILLACVLFLAGCGATGNGDGPAPAANDAYERTAEKGPVKLIIRVSPREPRLSDLVEMELRVEAQQGVEIKPPVFGQAVGDFLIRDYSERPKEAAEPNVRRFRYQLEPTHAGPHLIRSVSIEFIDKRAKSESQGEPTLIETDPLEIKVTSELGDATPDLANLEPMLPPQPVSQAGAIGWLAAAGGGLLLAIAAVVVLRRRNRRAVEPRKQTPEEIAHAALLELLKEDLPGRGLFKEFYLRLTGIVRQYIEGTTGIRAPEQTTEEFLRDMRSKAVFPPQRSNRLAEFLEAADMVKYAGQQPQGEQIEESIERAREFIELRLAPVEDVRV